MAGFYGNPSLGGAELGACRRCACPALDAQHSAECALSALVGLAGAGAGADEQEEDAYVCTACEPGYDGNKCEM